MAEELKNRRPPESVQEDSRDGEDMAILPLPRCRIRNMGDGGKNLTLHDVALTGDVEKARALIALGVDINAKNQHGNTPLHVVAREGHSAMVTLLRNQPGIDETFQNIFGQRPVDCVKVDDEATKVAFVASSQNDICIGMRNNPAWKNNNVFLCVMALGAFVSNAFGFPLLCVGFLVGTVVCGGALLMYPKKNMYGKNEKTHRHHSFLDGQNTQNLLRVQRDFPEEKPQVLVEMPKVAPGLSPENKSASREGDVPQPLGHSRNVNPQAQPQVPTLDLDKK
ncbi:MAG TPA: hypothetical protein DCW68_06455 [Rhodospirillaceae bacterium]|nr:MAG: hypothetical protein A2018_03770 [Alphaproteobacteria bacterium GWF2_58_20]HAU29730.1 hypothetical protein [Rhodospirillaceae bacterium]